MTTYHQVNSLQSQPRLIFLSSCVISGYGEWEREKEKGKSLSGNQPSPLPLACLGCTEICTHTHLCNAMSRRGRDTFRITFTAFTDKKYHSTAITDPVKSLLVSGTWNHAQSRGGTKVADYCQVVLAGLTGTCVWRRVFESCEGNHERNHH